MFSAVLFAAVGFLMDKEKERITPWVMVLLVVLVMQALGLSYSTVDMNVYLIVFGAALGGVGISSFWNFQRRSIPEQPVYITDDSGLGSLSDWKPEDLEKPVAAAEQFQVQATESGEETTEQIEYIENPLPGPRKHVAKSMDYDLEVADDDDFDI